ncbi:unnamed protein product [Sphagnum balticum]
MRGQRRKLQKQGTRGSPRAANEGNETGAEEAGDDEERGIMEGFPVELIGNILSHLDDMKDVVRASWTCRKWRVALRYLHTLCASWTKRELETERLEFVLTDTILQTIDCPDLEEVVVDTCEQVWATVQCFLLKPSSKLRKLQLYGIPLGGNHPVNLNLGTIPCLFPCLTHLGLSNTMLGNNSPIVESQFQGSTVFEGVQFFELRYPVLDEDLVLLMGRVLKRCPNLKKLQVVGTMDMDCRYMHDFMPSFVALVRKFSKVDFQFEKVIY